MKFRLLDLLRDPVDGTPLTASNVTTQSVSFDRPLTRVMCTQYCGLKDRPVSAAGVTPQDCSFCYSQEVTVGELVSAIGNRYPVVAGIPRLLARGTARWVEKNQATFSLEWKNFKFGERNWGQNIDYRQQLFLRGMAVAPPALHNKLLFDAGCGSGLLSMEVADAYGMEVLALDLAFGIEQAYKHNRNPFVYFVQGSVTEPPVKKHVADYLYCAGVLVAIPDPQAGLAALNPILKSGGRYFTWWYHPIDSTHHPTDRRKLQVYNWVRMHLISPLPIRVQQLIFLSVMPLYMLKRAVTNVFRRQKNTTTWREKMQDLTDMFSPLYQHRYSEEDILTWYRELGCVNSVIAYREAYGFGARGDAPPEAPLSPDTVTNVRHQPLTAYLPVAPVQS